ncbi:MAG: 4-hydroxythreonine-4-phosphate dehydrogenase PdxA [Clostridia bacterium]|nr:4-hydroxythreonine-4-phosphate dehydrogenase PdxA [Clostridia bacterium]
MNNPKKPLLLLTMGDPCGVGSEVIVKALAEKEVYARCVPVIIGEGSHIRRAAGFCNLPLSVREIRDPGEAQGVYGTLDVISLGMVPDDLPFGEVRADAGNAAFQYLKTAIEYCLAKKAQGIVTAPLNKEALHLGGHAYPGHTEILADLTGTKEYAMMLTAPKLRVIHLTTHLGLIDAVHAITKERTLSVIRIADTTLKRAGIADPRIAVSAINPHAGEGGLFGYGEEEEKLVPAIAEAVREGINASGPYPADTIYTRALKGEFDIVVAPYHDQGHVALKVLDFDAGVNITVGLNGGMIRTSVDHGTAFDIAGKNLAQGKSMLEAIYAACELAPQAEG